jgi:hypothetical protein
VVSDFRTPGTMVADGSTAHYTGPPGAHMEAMRRSRETIKYEGKHAGVLEGCKLQVMLRAGGGALFRGL